MSIERLTSRLRGFAIALVGVAALLAANPQAAVAGETLSGSAAGSPAAHSQATHGVVITWNESAGRFEAPDAASAAQLVRELRSLLAGETGRRAGLAEKVQVDVLPNGLARARLPASLIDLSILRRTGDGTFVPVCSQGPAAARRALAAPLASSAPAER